MIELVGNMISTTNTKFSKYEREVVDNEQNYGNIMFDVNMSLFYTPVYVDNRASIQNAQSLLQTSTVESYVIEGNVLTVKTRNSVYTFSLLV